jgi:hypothetical protein
MPHAADLLMGLTFKKLSACFLSLGELEGKCRERFFEVLNGGADGARTRDLLRDRQAF